MFTVSNNLLYYTITWLEKTLLSTITLNAASEKYEILPEQTNLSTVNSFNFASAKFREASRPRPTKKNYLTNLCGLPAGTCVVSSLLK